MTTRIFETRLDLPDDDEPTLFLTWISGFNWLEEELSPSGGALACRFTEGNKESDYIWMTPDGSIHKWESVTPIEEAHRMTNRAHRLRLMYIKEDIKTKIEESYRALGTSPFNAQDHVKLTFV